MIKFPSLNVLTEHFLQTLIRYKWVVLISLAKVITLIYYTETSHTEETLRNILTRLCYVFFLAVPLTLSISLFTERRQWKWYVHFGMVMILTAILTGYYITINDVPNQTDFYRFMLFMAGSHLLVSYISFVGFTEANGFWQFNKTLFLQFLNAALYSVTLYIGLLIAVETVKFLFNINFLFEIEADLAIFIFTFFHTIFFLSKIPKNLAELDLEIDYPIGLKIFTQYVLLPLEVVYLLILYAYTAKILFQWHLPEGGVAYLVLAFSSTGILALLLLYPLRDNIKERWIRLFSHQFYLALLPLIILLFTGIFRRINDYGITENRYVVAVLALWLAGITVYFLAGKRNDIRWIPITLSIFCFMLAVGPWNIFTVAKRSQINQFQEILKEHKLLNAKNKIEGKAVLSKKDYNQLFSIVQFFRIRDQSVLTTYFSKLPANYNEKRFSFAMDDYLRKHISTKQANELIDYTYFSSGSENVIDIKDFNQMLLFKINNGEDINQTEWKLVSKDHGKILDIYRNSNKIVSWNLAKKISELKIYYGNGSNEVPRDSLSLDYNDSKNHIRIVLESLSNDNEYYSGEGVLLY